MVAACLNSSGTDAFPEVMMGRYVALDAGARGFGCNRSPPCCVPRARVLVSLNSVSSKVPHKGERRWSPGCF